MAKSNKQNKLLKKYSKGGFSKAEKKQLSKKLGIKRKQANSLAKSYSKQLKVGAFGVPSTNKASGVSKPKNNTSKNSFNIPKPNKSAFPGVTTSYSSYVNKGKPKGTNQPNTPAFPGADSYSPYVNIGKPKDTTSPPPSGPVNPNDINDIISSVTDGRPDQPVLPDLTVDPRIGDLEGELETANTNLANLQNTYNESNQNYLTQIGGLRDDIGGFESQIGQYQSQISDLSTQLLDNAQKAKQFKQMDTQYLTNNNASGIRLRRSKRFKSGDFALGASGLNRKNRAPFKISNVNL